MNNIPVTFGIPTKDRYEALGNCLLSIALQTIKPQEVIIIDDSDNLKNITELPNLYYALKLLAFHNVPYRVEYGLKKGQHYSHQIIQDLSNTDWIFRIDDDCILESEVLELLWNEIKVDDKIGAVAPCILMPDPKPLPDISHNIITDIYSVPNMQWFLWTGYDDVEHLNSSFLYKKGIKRFNTNLSKVAHREETIFTHEIFRAGYKLRIVGDAHCWHFKQNSGGIRSYPDSSLYEHDENVFRDVAKSWNFKEDTSTKMIVLDNGLGDHFAFLHILPDLLKKYEKLTIAACYPDVFDEFKEYKIDIISIAKAKLLLGDIGKYNIYTWMADKRHKGNLVDAFKQFYLTTT